MEYNKDGQRYIMKIHGKLAKLLVEMEPKVYGPFLIQQSGGKVLYVKVLKAIYGILQSALLFYNKLWKDLKDSGFEVNPYDPYVANRTDTARLEKSR